MILNFVFKELHTAGEYFVAVDVLFPSFLVSMIVGFIVSKIYPPRKEAVEMIKEIDKE